MMAEKSLKVKLLQHPVQCCIHAKYLINIKYLLTLEITNF